MIAKKGFRILIVMGYSKRVPRIESWIKSSGFKRVCHVYSVNDGVRILRVMTTLIPRLKPSIHLIIAPVWLAGGVIKLMESAEELGLAPKTKFLFLGKAQPDSPALFLQAPIAKEALIQILEAARRNF